MSFRYVDSIPRELMYTDYVYSTIKVRSLEYNHEAKTNSLFLSYTIRITRHRLAQHPSSGSRLRYHSLCLQLHHHDVPD
jgi:hypothetical protein